MQGQPRGIDSALLMEICIHRVRNEWTMYDHYICIKHFNCPTCIEIFRNHLTLLYVFNASRGLHFLHLNVRSLWSKYDQVRQLLYNINISVLGLLESWLTSDFDKHLIEIPKYSCLRSEPSWSENNTSIKKGGGLCHCVSEDLIYSDSEYANFNI